NIQHNSLIMNRMVHRSELHHPMGHYRSRFASVYEEAGGVLTESGRARQYWRVRDALACSEEVQMWARPWRETGRTDLTPCVVEDRLDAYISLLMGARVH
ncbi:hypothetical protein, partial [Rhodococcus sp. IEGM 1343]|uniref:hypothetical protein n=1 Tax=Rhodococcus sp. IEGM 1343 TaxID=3082224 RepID=UPI0029529F57